MPFKQCILIVELIFVMLSCSERKISEDVIILNLDENVQDTIYYSSFVDSISYIPLETTDDCLIGKIKDVVIADSFIFVLDNNPSAIYIFDRSGKYLRKIDRQGEGLGEYSFLMQFSYNKKRQSLSVYTTGKFKVIEYDLYGNLINEFKLDYFIADLYQFDNGDYLFTRCCTLDDMQATALICDSTGRVKNQLLHRDKRYSIKINNVWEIAEFDNTLNFMSPLLDNSIYCYTNDKLVNTFSFNLLPEPTTDEFVYKPGTPWTYYYRVCYKESRDWVQLNYWSDVKGLRLVIFNKKKNIYEIGKIFKNDIDGKRNGNMLSASEGNTFSYWLENDNEDMNPVLQILHLKNN